MAEQSTIDMNAYKNTRNVLNSMYYDNFLFWKKEKENGAVSEWSSPKDLAINDIQDIEYNPFSPDGGKLDDIAKQQWLDEMNQDYVMESEVPNTKSTSLLDHKDNVLNTINNDIPHDNDGYSYISKNDLNEILDDHLNRVQDLIDYHKNDIMSYNEERSSLRDNLTKTASDFKNSIKERINNKYQETKQATKDRIESIKDTGRTKLKNGIIKINESIKDFSANIDKKLNLEENKSSDGLYWYQSNNGKIDIDDIPENAKAFSNDKHNGDIVAFDNSLGDDEQNKLGLKSFNLSKDDGKEQQTKNIENETDLER